MKKWIIYSLISLLIITLLLIFLVPLFLPLERVKDFAASKASEILKREVKIKKVSFNIFNGIVLKGLSINEAKGFSPEPFVEVDAVELRYDLWSLFSGKFQVNEINIVKPKIKIEKSASGVFNFSDLMTKKEPKGSGQVHESPINLSISKISVSKGLLTFIFHSRSGAEKYQLLADISVADPLVAPRIAGSVSSDKLVLDPLLEGPKDGRPAPYGALTRTVNDLTRSIPDKLTMSLLINLKDISHKTLKIDRINVGLALAQKVLAVDLKDLSAYEGQVSGKGKVDLNVSGLSYRVDGLELKNLNAGPFSNAVVESFMTGFPKYKELKNKVFGRLELSVDLSGRGVETADILKNAEASGNLTLSNGKLSHLESMASLAEFLKYNALKEDLVVRELKGEFSLEDRFLTLKGLSVDSGDIRVVFDGSVDFTRFSRRWWFCFLERQQSEPDAFAERLQGPGAGIRHFAGRKGNCFFGL